MGYKTALFHVAALGFFVLVSYRVQIDKRISPDPTVRNMQRFSLRFLTNWTFTLQMIYFGLRVLAHLSGILSRRLAGSINAASNYLAISVTAPMSFVVSVAFWSIYSVDRELVFPKALDLVLPPFLNHSIHTMNALLSLADLLACTPSRLYPRNTSPLLTGLVLYLLVYSVCLYGTYYVEGVWLYPFLALLTWPQRALASLAVLAISIIFLYMTKLLHRLVHGLPQPEPSGRKQHKKRT